MVGLLMDAVFLLVAEQDSCCVGVEAEQGWCNGGRGGDGCSGADGWRHWLFYGSSDAMVVKHWLFNCQHVRQLNRALIVLLQQCAEWKQNRADAIVVEMVMDAVVLMDGCVDCFTAEVVMDAVVLIDGCVDCFMAAAMVVRRWLFYGSSVQKLMPMREKLAIKLFDAITKNSKFSIYLSPSLVKYLRVRKLAIKFLMSSPKIQNFEFT
jgi:hypothetical protein